MSGRLVTAGSLLGAILVTGGRGGGGGSGWIYGVGIRIANLPTTIILLPLEVNRESMMDTRTLV